MNSSQILGGEAIVAIAVASWRAIGQGYAPLPEDIVRVTLSFAVLGVVGIVSPDLAALLGAGMLLAELIKMLSGAKTLSLPAGYQNKSFLVIGNPPEIGK